MQEISFDELAAIVLRVAMRWVAVAFVAGLTSGLGIRAMV